MRKLGIIRSIDDLGRIVIPMEVRKTLGWGSGTPMEMQVDNDTLIVSEYKIKCILCGNDENLTEFMGKKLCEDCVEKIKNI